MNKFKVGDEIVFTCNDVGDNTTDAGVVIEEISTGIYPYRIKLNCTNLNDWLVEESELRFITKLERALK